jgi:phage/plasmid-associated DNA primase
MENNLELGDLLENSLSGYLFDVACIIYRMYKNKYVAAKLKSKYWFMFDGLKWNFSEIGPYHDISTDVVKLYMNLRHQAEEDLKAIDQQRHVNYISSHQEEEGGATTAIVPVDDRQIQYTIDIKRRRLDKINALIAKLKNVNYKESLCKECLYMFYDADFLTKLDKNRNLICFKNGVLDNDKKEFREGQPSDYITLFIDDSYIQMTNAFQEKVQRFMEFREKILSKRKGSYMNQGWTDIE